ncbi:hypothetical protein D3C85_1865790 [compost metagenome]
MPILFVKSLKPLICSKQFVELADFVGFYFLKVMRGLSTHRVEREEVPNVDGLGIGYSL